MCSSISHTPNHRLVSSCLSLSLIITLLAAYAWLLSRFALSIILSNYYFLFHFLIRHSLSIRLSFLAITIPISHLIFFISLSLLFSLSLSLCLYLPLLFYHLFLIAAFSSLTNYFLFFPFITSMCFKFSLFTLCLYLLCSPSFSFSLSYSFFTTINLFLILFSFFTLCVVSFLFFVIASF